MEDEGVALRLVRCPKCENVLPELPEYSVYQCGGCGAVLKGKQVTPTTLETSDTKNGTRVESSTKQEVMLESSSQVKKESDEFEAVIRQGRMVHEKAPYLTPSSSSRKEKRDFFAHSDKSRRRRLDFGPIRSRSGGLHRNASTVEKGRFGNLPYSNNEGPSSSNLSSFNSFGDHVTRVTNNAGLHEFSMVQDLEKDRTELLKKLDELRTQLSRSCNVTESPNGRLNGSYPWPHHPPHQQYIPPTFHNPFLDYNQRDTLLHRPSCACSQCYNVNWQPLPPKAHPFSSYTSQETSYPLPEPLHYGPRHLPHYDGFGRRYPRRRVILTHGGERVSFPISGGAPFISCCNCFELLKIPKKVTFSGKNDRKTIKCAVCFALISLRLEDNKIVASFCSTVGQQKVNKRKSNRSPHSSLDYDECVYNFQLTDTEQNSSAGGAEKKEDHMHVPILKSQNGVLTESLLKTQNDVSTESLLKTQNDVLTESQRNNQEQVIIDHDNKKYLKDALVANEIDVSLTDYLNTGVSKENDRSRSKKVGNESFFAGLIKKRLKDFSRSSSGVVKVRSNVFVNGQLLTNRAVKKAEKLAGPIHPGEYWYDSVAGFWGVMNQPCLGIIPPFIEEFDHPMPKNCAAGNTSVFVNRRELNQKDLDLLAGRGLPTTKDRSYIVEISGKVVDEDTGEELDALGKLAPTVERVQHGFGMKVPKVVAT